VPCHKLNIGALGNVVAQLHVHVIARTRIDAVWPKPVWAQGTAESYDEAVAADLIRRLTAAFAA
jgi:diadenosine tetraphosphate (Ap4A) HIT family hydrolase